MIRTTIKKRVALLMGFMGQPEVAFARNLNDRLLTIEEHIEHALCDAGVVLERNRHDAKKLGWNRSSRTDKGVSASGLVFSVKLDLPAQPWRALEAEIPADSFNSLDSQGKQQSSSSSLSFDARAGLRLAVENQLLLPVAMRMNRCLQATEGDRHLIRVLSMKRVRSGFDARKDCIRRHYDYVLPFRLVRSDGASASAFVDRVRASLRLFVGNVYVHNFASTGKIFSTLSRAAHQPRGRRGRRSNDERADIYRERKQRFEESGVGHSVDASSSVRSDEHCFQVVDVADDDMSRFCEVRRRTPQLYRRIERFECSLVDVDGEQCLAFGATGSGFLLNQIRKMIGGVLAAAAGGVMHSRYLELALRGPWRMHVPLAPAWPLLLASVDHAGPRSSQTLYNYSNRDMFAGARPLQRAYREQLVSAVLVPRRREPHDADFDTFYRSAAQHTGYFHAMAEQRIECYDTVWQRGESERLERKKMNRSTSS
jgi:tRNA pseudouridine38-40 synthase